MSKIYWSWKNIKGSLRRIWQNINWGWNESDIWSLDCTIAEFVLPRLKFLKEHQQGYPILDGYDGKDGSKKCDKKMRKEWKQILDKMILSFEYILIDNQDLYNKYLDIDKRFSLPFKSVPLNDGSDCYKMELDGTKEDLKVHNHLWKNFSRESKNREKYIEEGLYLFARYFRALWD